MDILRKVTSPHLKKHLFFPALAVDPSGGWYPSTRGSVSRCDAGFPAARPAAARTAFPLGQGHDGRGLKLQQIGRVCSRN